jgi:hypothetical protein
MDYASPFDRYRLYVAIVGFIILAGVFRLVGVL